MWGVGRPNRALERRLFGAFAGCACERTFQTRPEFERRAGTSAWGDALMPALCVALLSCVPLAAVHPERYVSASVTHTGDLQIVTADGRTLTIAREEGEVGYDKVAVSRDGAAVGWVGLQPNCCTSYPIPTRLFVYTAGGRRSFAGTGLPVWNWRFMNGGARVALHQETVHGGLGAHYELRDVATGGLIAEWEPPVGPDNRQLPNQTPPGWVRELNEQRGDWRGPPGRGAQPGAGAAVKSPGR